MAGPVWHVLATAPVAALAGARSGLAAGFAAGAAGVLVDGDHLLDWVLNGGREDYSRRVVVLLHGWEYPVLLLGVAWLAPPSAAARRVAPALAAGWLCHLTLDFLVNRPEMPAGYSVLYRMRHRFRRQVSGWLPEGEWRRRHLPKRRRPFRRAAAAALAGMGVVLLTTGC